MYPTSFYPARMIGLLLLLLLAGCGGDLGPASGLVVRAVVNVNYNALDAQQTKADTTTPGAESMVLFIPGANSDGSNLSATFNRDLTQPAAHTEVYTVLTALEPGAVRISVKFYDMPNGQGNLLTSLNTQVTVTNNQLVINIDNTAQPPASVVVVPNQELPVQGNARSILFSPTDAQGNLIPVAPGEITLTLLTGANLVKVDTSDTNPANLNQVTGVAPGTVTLTVTLRQVVSNVLTLRVWQVGSTSASVVVTSGQSVQVGSFKTLAVVAKDTSGQIVQLDPTDLTFNVIDNPQNLTTTADKTQVEGLVPGGATVTATVGGTTSLKQAVNVYSNTRIAISPTSASLTTYQHFSFKATVTGSPNTNVNWQARDSTGTVITNSVQGPTQQPYVFTAPGTPGKYTVIATSDADPTQSATATVTVSSGTANFTVQ